MRIYESIHHETLRLWPGASEFLSHYSTNTPELPRGIFADTHGRIVAAYDQYRVSADESLLAVAHVARTALLNHLAKYLALADSKMELTSHRVYFDLNGDAARIVFSEKEIPATVSEEEFTLFRLRHKIPLQGRDYDHPMVLDVFDDADRVSYTKGCYLGQEIIARVHFRAKPPKKLVVCYEDELPPERRAPMTSRTTDPASGRTLGFLLIDNE